MNNLIGLRREDKNQWERRVPLTPTHIARLIQQHQIEFLVQPSPIRAFPDAGYAAAGATVQEDLSAAQIILAIKEIPIELLERGKTYLFFSHTIKGQPHNMPLLRRLLELDCQLIDYERVVDEHNRRLIFFGQHAGLAGMIDTLRALGQRLAWEGWATPLADIRPTYMYADLFAAQSDLRLVGQRLIEEGWPLALTPLVIGLAGYGNVSRGAQAILDLLPTHQISPAELLTLADREDLDRNIIYKVVFKEEDTVEPIAPGQSFNLQEFFQHPERYRSKFEQYLPHLTVLVNCIYWDARYPRLLTKAATRQLYSGETPPKLRVIGDISCDIEGGIEPTIKATEPDAPTFVWEPITDTALDGVAGHGPVIMAVDNLPCELPVEASTSFSEALLPFIPALAACNFSVDFEQCALPPELKRATIVYHGALTPDYRYLEKFLTS
ncbi:MAG: bifunctional lysine ketoglutarate reductase /saccharopine dehydrogenase family protein [Anaerolineae bacterium]|nr:bifunctional lysine ketoglutarate reductase /saccharopine dehydrogenase family protein [Anaerolineae bacterium]